MSILSKTISQCTALSRTGYSRGLQTKGVIDIGPSPGMGQLSAWADQGANRERYNLFRGWVYPPVNAIAETGAGQKICVGKIKIQNDKARPGGKKHYEDKIPNDILGKAADQEIEIFQQHWLLDVLKQPNPIQTKWDFIYSFLANLCLTGWSYVIGGQVGTKAKPKVEFYCLPTTWVTPDHSKEPFGSIAVKNPRKPGEPKILERGEFGFARLPNPSDPLAALAPAGTQLTALRIDDYIQSSRERFFQNGIFPSVLVKMGSNPHPDVPAGIRPRLTADQRRQVYGTIRKMIGGVANYGNPAILDGYIEGIERLSMTNTEMGWEKSEEINRKRILAAYNVHPYILGEAVSVGGYAQVANIEKRFYAKVNSLLDLFSGVMTSFAGPIASIEDDVMIWVEKCIASDPQMDWQNRNQARSRGDITQNELRAFMGMPPDEDNNEQILDKGMMQGINQILAMKAKGEMEVDQAVAYLEGLGIPTKMAKRIVGPKVEKPPAPEPGQIPGQPPKPGQKPPEEQAIEELKKAAKLMRSPYLIDANEHAEKLLIGI